MIQYFVSNTILLRDAYSKQKLLLNDFVSELYLAGGDDPLAVVSFQTQLTTAIVESLIVAANSIALPYS